MNLPDKYDKLLAIALCAALCVLWFWLALREEGDYPKLHDQGIGTWVVTCHGHGRTYRLRSENTASAHSGLRVLHRSLSLLDGVGEELYYTVRFDPDAYETHGVWRFRTGWDSRLFAPRWRASEVLYGDEERFEISAAFDALTVVTSDGRRIVLACQRRPPDG